MWFVRNISFVRWVFTLLSKRLKNKVEEITLEYEELIQEYYKIQNKKSKLSRNKRDFVEQRIAFLVKKGHIKIG